MQYLADQKYEITAKQKTQNVLTNEADMLGSPCSAERERKNTLINTRSTIQVPTKNNGTKLHRLDLRVTLGVLGGPAVPVRSKHAHVRL